MIKKLKAKFKQRKIRKAQEREQLNSLYSSYDNAKITWNAPEHIKQEKGILWKIIMIGLVIVAAIFGFIYNAWTFSLAILVFAVVYYIVQRENPKEVEVKISDIGIKVGNRKYPYSRIKAFWIFYTPPYIETLNIRVHGDLVGDVVIQLHNTDPSQIREFLIEKIPEFEGKTESLTDALLRLFKI